MPLRSGNARYVQGAAVGFRKARLVQVLVQRRSVGAVENDLRKANTIISTLILPPFNRIVIIVFDINKILYSEQSERTGLGT